jgi:sugar/nucleoside kinase (ribokinase family)
VGQHLRGNEKTIDCLVCGTCVADILVKPVNLGIAIGGNRLWHVEPIRIEAGGIVSNTGTAMARLGMRTGAFARVGNDAWANALLNHFKREGISTEGLLQSKEGVTGATAVLIGEDGERSFAHHQGLAAKLNAADIYDNFSLFVASRMILFGHYSLLPDLESELETVLPKLQQAKCLTALDSAGSGGDRDLLFRLLPYLDFYIPSFAEASQQTSEADPERILNVYRSSGANGVIGVKLGSQGALLSSKVGELIRVNSVSPPGMVRDTTGAGDAFLGGLLTGVSRGMNLKMAAQLGAAAAAYCITDYGAVAGLRNWNETAQLAEIN